VCVCVFCFVTLLQSNIFASDISVDCCSLYSRGYLMKFQLQLMKWLLLVN
jgi:hypothetical protein